MPVKSETMTVDDYEDIEVPEKVSEAAKGEIADPLESFNRAMYHFNDKLYFWLIKPVAQGYQKVVPEVARIGVNNFFTNLAFPVRFVNSLLQADFGGATTELGRFLLNTLCGMGGLFDPASHEEINLAKQERDLGQTLGSFGWDRVSLSSGPSWGLPLRGIR
jgi:phospholipid-binding lipoprotein MlaA